MWVPAAVGENFSLEKKSEEKKSENDRQIQFK